MFSPEENCQQNSQFEPGRNRGSLAGTLDTAFAENRLTTNRSSKNHQIVQQYIHAGGNHAHDHDHSRFPPADKKPLDCGG